MLIVFKKLTLSSTFLPVNGKRVIYPGARSTCGWDRCEFHLQTSLLFTLVSLLFVVCKTNTHLAYPSILIPIKLHGSMDDGRLSANATFSEMESKTIFMVDIRHHKEITGG